MAIIINVIYFTHQPVPEKRSKVATTGKKPSGENGMDAANPLNKKNSDT